MGDDPIRPSETPRWRSAVLFTGYAELVVDPKGRLAIPAKFRTSQTVGRSGGSEDSTSTVWRCMPFPGDTLRLFTEERFVERFGGEDSRSLAEDPDEADLETRLFSLTEKLETDSAGRIVIPKLHQQLARLETEVVVLGVRDHLEVKNRSSWKANLESDFQQLRLLMDRVSSKRRKD